MQLIKILPLLATLVLASAIRFTIPDGSVIHVCPFPVPIFVSWDFVSTDPNKADLYESCKNGDLSGVKLLSMDVNVKARGLWVYNSDPDKPILPSTKCRFRLVSTESKEILAESKDIDVVCPLSSVSLTLGRLLGSVRCQGFSNFMVVVCWTLVF
jgi:hypothetical protein